MSEPEYRVAHITEEAVLLDVHPENEAAPETPVFKFSYDPEDDTDDETEFITVLSENPRLRETVYELGKLVDHGWLADAYCEAGPEDIITIDIDSENIHVNIMVLTFSGATEWVQFTITVDSVTDKLAE